MSIPQGTSRILTASSSNTSLQLLSAGQVAFHTDNTEIWKDHGLPRMTGHLGGWEGSSTGRTPGSPFLFH